MHGSDELKIRTILVPSHRRKLFLFLSTFAAVPTPHRHHTTTLPHCHALAPPTAQPHLCHGRLGVHGGHHGGERADIARAHTAAHHRLGIARARGRHGAVGGMSDESWWRCCASSRTLMWCYGISTYAVPCRLNSSMGAFDYPFFDKSRKEFLFVDATIDAGSY